MRKVILTVCAVVFVVVLAFVASTYNGSVPSVGQELIETVGGYPPEPAVHITDDNTVPEAVWLEMQNPEPSLIPEPTPTPTPEETPEETPSSPVSAFPIGEADPDKPMIALTFDDGPSGHTERILDLLKEYGGRASFCVVGNMAEHRPGTIRRAFNEGNEILGHSWGHADLTTLSEDALRRDLTDTAEKIEQLTGVYPALFRPPYGSYNDTVVSVSEELGFSVLMWSVDTNDWRTRSADAVYSHVMNYAKDGSVVLMHDLHGTTADAMERVIPELIEKGFQLVTVSELMYYRGMAVEAGRVYYGVY